MKKYKIIVKDKKTGATMQDEEIRTLHTKKRLLSDLGHKYRFNKNPVSISVERIVNVGGKQLDLLDAIKDVELGL